MTENKNENSSKKPEPPEKYKIPTDSIYGSGEIRCYSRAGFFAPEEQPDGSVIQRFYYGREGD